MSIPPHSTQSNEDSLGTIADVYEYSRIVSLADMALMKHALVDWWATKAVAVPAIAPAATLIQSSDVS